MDTIPTTEEQLGPYLAGLARGENVDVYGVLLPILRDGTPLAGYTADWLSSQPDLKIPAGLWQPIINALQQAGPGEDSDVHSKKRSALQLAQHSLAHQYFQSLEIASDHETQTVQLQKLLELHSRQVVNELVDRWMGWLVCGERPDLVETAAAELRTEPFAVLPLVERFARPLELTDPLRATILRKTVAPASLEVIAWARPDVLDGASQADPKLPPEREIKKLLDSFTGRGPGFQDLKSKLEGAVSDAHTSEARSLVGEFVDLLLEEERARRELLAYRRIASQLAHMSDERFFSDGKSEAFESVRCELKQHAKPVIIFNLQKRTDLETRQSLALMLGYLGDREAIDTLVQMLVGEEQARANRQEMLSEYYLKPSRQYSQQATEILSTAVGDARNTMRSLQLLNTIVFGVGIALIVSGVVIAILGEQSWTRLAGAFTTFGGLMGLLVQMVRNPLDRIQNTIARLVQIETAFTSFIWQLNLNGAFIQSQYVANGVLNDYDIVRSAGRMEGSMKLTMEQISAYSKDCSPEETGQPQAAKP